MTCPSCRSEVPDTSRFCSICGSAVGAANEFATIAMPDVSPQPKSSGSGESQMSMTAARMQSTRLPKSGRFAPGTMLAGRYQIVGLLGKGGMGEVYRANDLTLDQDVALKLLPEGMGSNPAMLSRFHGEVRIARQVSHPNVCRVYDLGEVDGQMFLSMEYVDGEDLGSLLRRIGRLPGDKAAEVARKICAGLAAAHDKGVLHRDLKPANVMINGEGNVVIMDFGLAAVADQIEGQEIKAGTPAYMSPEQLAGREVTVRSDIYGLGLVIHEILTGKRPFDAKTLPELIAQQHQVDRISMSTTVKDLDPAVERVVMRCLAPDPKNRPASALAVAAALPGGDPLAAALAAGETPSPEMVAASGQSAVMRPIWAVVCGLVILCGAITAMALASTTRVMNRAPLELPPDALAYKAREVAAAAGYTEKPADTASGFLYDQDYLQFLTKLNNSPSRWSRIGVAQPPAVVYWFRQSPRIMNPLGDNSRVSLADPPALVSGMLTLQLDPKGRLYSLSAVPPQLDDPAAPPAAPVNWTALLASAGLDPARLKPATPKWTPATIADTRVAWEGTWPDWPEQPLRVEAASYRGRPVYFDLIGPWTRPERMQARAVSAAERATLVILLSFAVGMLLGAALLARYNFKRGRGDRSGANRVGSAVFLLFVALSIIGGEHSATAHEVARLLTSIAYALLFGAAIWVGYMALEPYVRRHWPRAIVSWTRLLAGGINDPLVGRDVLIGVALGVTWGVVTAVSHYTSLSAGPPSAAVLLQPLMGFRFALASILGVGPGSLIQLFVSFLLLFFLRMVLRKEWLAAVVFLAAFTGLQLVGTQSIVTDGALSFAVALTIYAAMTLFGFVTFVVAVYVNTVLVVLPLTLDFSVWYAGVALAPLVMVLAIGAYGMHAALAGRSLIQDDLL